MEGGRTPLALAADRLLTLRREENLMGRGILLWLLGIPIPLIILILLLWH